MLELDGSQIKVLRLGLQSAFVGPDAFDVFLREDLDKHLNFYAGGEDPFPIAAFKLIEGAKAEGWVDARKSDDAAAARCAPQEPEYC